MGSGKIFLRYKIKIYYLIKKKKIIRKINLILFNFFQKIK